MEQFESIQVSDYKTITRSTRKTSIQSFKNHYKQLFSKSHIMNMYEPLNARKQPGRLTKRSESEQGISVKSELHAVTIQAFKRHQSSLAQVTQMENNETSSLLTLNPMRTIEVEPTKTKEQLNLLSKTIQTLQSELQYLMPQFKPNNVTELVRNKTHLIMVSKEFETKVSVSNMKSPLVFKIKYHSNCDAVINISDHRSFHQKQTYRNVTRLEFKSDQQTFAQQWLYVKIITLQNSITIKTTFPSQDIDDVKRAELARLKAEDPNYEVKPDNRTIVKLKIDGLDNKAKVQSFKQELKALQRDRYGQVGSIVIQNKQLASPSRLTRDKVNENFASVLKRKKTIDTARLQQKMFGLCKWSLIKQHKQQVLQQQQILSSNKKRKSRFKVAMVSHKMILCMFAVFMKKKEKRMNSLKRDFQGFIISRKLVKRVRLFGPSLAIRLQKKIQVQLTLAVRFSTVDQSAAQVIDQFLRLNEFKKSFQTSLATYFNSVLLIQRQYLKSLSQDKMLRVSIKKAIVNIIDREIVNQKAALKGQSDAYFSVVKIHATGIAEDFFKLIRLDLKCKNLILPKVEVVKELLKRIKAICLKLGLCAQNTKLNDLPFGKIQQANQNRLIAIKPALLVQAVRFQLEISKQEQLLFEKSAKEVSKVLKLHRSKQ